MRKYILIGLNISLLAVGLYLPTQAGAVTKAPAAAPRPRTSSTAPAAPRVFQATGNYFCDQFMNMLTSNKSPTMDGFLGTVNSNVDFLQSIRTRTAFYNSQARHGTTFQDPRALIMYGNSELVLAFNGSRDEAFYDSLETMCYNPNLGRFEFRKIQFKSEQTPTSQPNTEVEFENSLISVTRANPTSCAECHGTTFVRPSWGAYLSWRGSFGSYEESFALNKSRYAHDDQNLELTQLMKFQDAAPQKERYRRFPWGSNRSEASGLMTSNTLFGILLNYKLSNASIRTAIASLRQAANDKFKYAFTGYLLDCKDNFVPSGSPYSGGRSDNEGDLRPLMSTMMSSRFRFEVGERIAIQNDLAQRGSRLTWTNFSMPALPLSISLDDTITRAMRGAGPAPLALTAAITTRPDSIYKFARMEQLYGMMRLSTESLHYREGQTSWDGYNEIQDYMADYILKYYGLPLITPVQKSQAETAGVRSDLSTYLLDEDYRTAAPAIASLQLPAMGGGGRAQLCADLATASRTVLAR